MVRHVVSLLNGQNSASTIINQTTVLDAIKWLKVFWDQVNESTIRNCFKKYSFSLVEGMAEEAQDDAEFQYLFQFLTIEVFAKEYLPFDDDAETNEETVNTTQVDWHKKLQRCIQEVTKDAVEN